jgi:hypothetical protein
MKEKIMPKLKTEEQLSARQVIAHNLIELYGPLLDPARDQTDTSPGPKETNKAFHINFDGIIGAVWKRYIAAEKFEATCRLDHEKKLETDPKEQDIRTTNSGLYATRAGEAWFAALQLRQGFDQAYEVLTGKCFEYETWLADTQAYYNNKPTDVKTQANAAAKALAARKKAA